MPPGRSRISSSGPSFPSLLHQQLMGLFQMSNSFPLGTLCALAVILCCFRLQLACMVSFMVDMEQSLIVIEFHQFCCRARCSECKGFAGIAEFIGSNCCKLMLIFLSIFCKIWTGCILTDKVTSALAQPPYTIKSFSS